MTAPGPYGVQQITWTLEDPVRGRSWDGLAWLPERGAEPAPLVIYHHGGGAVAADGRQAATLLASHGTVVFAPNILGLRSTGMGLDGLDLLDGVNQVGDTRALLDAILGVTDGFSGAHTSRVDAARIGLMGFSAGGVTAVMAGFHPELRDPRVRAVAVFASPIAFALEPSFFASSEPSLLWAHGTLDAIVDYEANAPSALANGPDRRVLVTVVGGNHVGNGLTDLVPLAELVAGRPVVNQDDVACIFGAFDDAGDIAFVDQWGDASIGIVIQPNVPFPCSTGVELEPTIDGDLQARIVDTSARAFFESHFEKKFWKRAGMLHYLRRGLEHELGPDAMVDSVIDRHAVP